LDFSKKFISNFTKEEKVVIIFLLFSLAIGILISGIGKEKIIYDKTVKREIAFPVDLNQANFKQLISIPGIGPSTAQRIISYRYKIGKFENINQLSEIKGIGKKKLDKIKSYLKINP
jgi:competence ComEA-like helix-hairpin-helix protein